jgi:hypothetical protein
LTSLWASDVSAETPDLAAERCTVSRLSILPTTARVLLPTMGHVPSSNSPLTLIVISVAAAILSGRRRNDGH